MHETSTPPLYSVQSITFPRLIRQYTFTCEQDYLDIQEGFCPQYAMYWLDEQNRCHWPEGTPIRHRPEYLASIPSLIPSSTHFEQRCFSPPTSPLSFIRTIPSSSSAIVQPSSPIIHSRTTNHKNNTPNKNTTKNRKVVRFDSFREIIPFFDDSFG